MFEVNTVMAILYMYRHLLPILQTITIMFSSENSLRDVINTNHKYRYLYQNNHKSNININNKT